MPSGTQAALTSRCGRIFGTLVLQHRWLGPCDLLIETRYMFLNIKVRRQDTFGLGNLRHFPGTCHGNLAGMFIGHHLTNGGSTNAARTVGAVVDELFPYHLCACLCCNATTIKSWFLSHSNSYILYLICMKYINSSWESKTSPYDRNADEL